MPDADMADGQQGEADAGVKGLTLGCRGLARQSCTACPASCLLLCALQQTNNVLHAVEAINLSITFV